MEHMPILTIAVPTFNMEWCLEKNLATYQDQALWDRLEVLCLNNDSEDGSRVIMKRFEKECPRIFKVVDRPSKSYGGSVNEAISVARGRYFRIVDADDWVDTLELIKLVGALESCCADVVFTDYQTVDLMSGAVMPVRAADKGVEYNRKMCDFDFAMQTLPSIHATTYRTELLRESKFQMQDDIFFVDEEYVILPYLWVKSTIYYPFDVYRYQVANPEQSTSPENRAKYRSHRERVLRRLVKTYQETSKNNFGNPALPYCFRRICLGVGDHFTTLYMYMEDRREGRKLAKEWKLYLKKTAPEFWERTKKKALALEVLNFGRVSLCRYMQLKRLLLKRSSL